MRILHLAPEAGDESGIAAYAVRFRRAVGLAGAHIEPLGPVTGSPGSVAEAVRYAAAARAAAPGFDVVHAELGGSSLRELRAALAVARRGLAPLVVTAHDPPRLVWRPLHTALVREHRALRAAAAVLGEAPGRRIERTLARRAAAVLALSQLGARRTAQALGTRVATLPYPCEPLGPGTEPPPAGNGLVVGFHGYWYRGKGIEVLLEALARARADGASVRLRLWGAPPAGGGAGAGARYAGAVRSAIARLDLGDAVDVRGRLSAEHVADALGSCHVIAFPYEDRWTIPGLASVSSAVFDALACGAPVVASDVRAIGETVEDGVDGLLVGPGDPDALAAVLRRLHDDRALREALRAGAAAHAAAMRLDAAGHAALAVYRGAIAP